MFFGLCLVFRMKSFDRPTNAQPLAEPVSPAVSVAPPSGVRHVRRGFEKRDCVEGCEANCDDCENHRWLCCVLNCATNLSKQVGQNPSVNLGSLAPHSSRCGGSQIHRWCIIFLQVMQRREVVSQCQRLERKRVIVEAPSLRGTCPRPA